MENEKTHYSINIAGKLGENIFNDISDIRNTWQHLTRRKKSAYEISRPTPNTYLPT